MRHEVMIPMEFNTDAVEQKLEKDGYDELMGRIYERCEQELPKKWGYGSNREVSWKEFVERAADRFMDSHKNEILEAAAKRMVDRMVKTKAYREAVAEAVSE